MASYVACPLGSANCTDLARVPGKCPVMKSSSSTTLVWLNADLGSPGNERRQQAQSYITGES
jgi:hypothetical protein